MIEVHIIPVPFGAENARKVVQVALCGKRTVGEIEMADNLAPRQLPPAILNFMGQYSLEDLTTAMHSTEELEHLSENQEQR